MKTTVSTLHSRPSVSKLCVLAIIIPIRGKLSCANAELKIFRDDATDYPSITQSASEDQDMSAASHSGPSNSIDLRTQTASDLSGPQPEATSARSVENVWAAAGKVVEDTVEPNEPSEWISKCTAGIDTVKSMIDAVKSVSRFLATNV